MDKATLEECIAGMEPMGLALALCRALELTVRVDNASGELCLFGSAADRLCAALSGPYVIAEERRA